MPYKNLEARRKCHRMAQRRYEKTAKGKATKSRYNKSQKGRDSTARYLQSEDGKIVRDMIESSPHRKLLKRIRSQNRRTIQHG